MFATRFLTKDKFDNYEDYIKNAIPTVPENFNFAYDVIDVIASETPDKIAIMWINDTGDKKTISFKQLSQMSNSVANFLSTRGIKTGDTVLLFLRRRWEYWVLMMAMHKLGAIPIPSTNQLKSEDIKYRIQVSDTHTIIAFDDGIIMNEIKDAISETNAVQIIDCSEITRACTEYPTKFERIPNQNTDTMVVYFTSGTTDNPKMVAHNFTYPLGT